ncbi:MAG: nucleotidyltransferase domain-containing protein [Candidatus Methanoperedens sp.]|nr:nucleotidyltransferase domain-containing protein [Candidatus Methanoperedens sp.]MCZ7405227.1 nucleotidyltransferase domain-containing protein [Candidatus Methanoperedens sp.]
MKKIQNSEIKSIKENILKTLHEIGISAHEIILFGSRARQDFTPLSDYDVLIITEKPFEINKKMSISKNIRQYLARSGLDVDVIIKSVNEVNILKDKPGSIVRNALKEGVAL